MSVYIHYRAIKMLSEIPVEDNHRGIYSHRMCGGKWLVGGASNVGCKILREEGFSNDELALLSETINPMMDSPLQYYPLTKPGERFPIQDPNKQPCLEPRPTSRVEYLHGILQGIAMVERDAYSALEELGASKLQQVLTAGGGSKNLMWTAMRQRLLGVETISALNAEAAFGAALLAKMYHHSTGLK
jgi:sugar (pentulose or hexulose) kinase